MTDSELLTQFTQGSDKAFAELVQRHIDLVFAAALRQIAGDRASAEDITQKVFIDLARKARTLTGHPTLVGWLYSSVRYTAINTRRSEQRRVAREKQFDFMTTTTSGTETRWEQIRPVIDDALQELDEDDRQSVLLRFFGNQPFAAIGAQLGMSENAAQKRVDRALDRLSVALRRKGISSTVMALGLALAESGVAAPATLAVSVTSAALAGATGVGAGAAALTGGLKIAAAAVVAGAVGWVGFGWLRPKVIDHRQSLPPVVTNAEPAIGKTGSDRVAVEASPKSSELIPAKAVDPVPLSSASISAPTPAPKIYVVSPGDTLKRIASTVGVTTEVLRAENPGYDFARMRVGEVVRLPASVVDPRSVEQVAAAIVPIPSEQVYFILPGDTLQKIAQKKDLLPAELEALNPEINWQQLKVGQKIRAP